MSTQIVARILIKVLEVYKIINRNINIFLGPFSSRLVYVMDSNI